MPRPCSPSSAVCTSYPSRTSCADSTRRRLGSSSTTRICSRSGSISALLSLSMVPPAGEGVSLVHLALSHHSPWTPEGHKPEVNPGGPPVGNPRGTLGVDLSLVAGKDRVKLSAESSERPARGRREGVSMRSPVRLCSWFVAAGLSLYPALAAA